MLTDEEALQKAEDEYWMNGSPEFRTGFHAALAWLRSQGEPVAWMNAKKDMTYFGHYNPDDVPLFLAPQPAIPDDVEPLTDSFVQTVPDKCDRIVWRGHYYQLPFTPEPKSC